MSLGQGQGHFSKMFLGGGDSWTANCFSMINLRYKYSYRAQYHLKVKVIFRSKSLWNQIVSVWISTPKRAVSLRPNAFLLNKLKINLI